MGGFFQESIKNRGLLGTVRRGFSVMNRYGVTRNKIPRNLITLNHILQEYGAIATIPITVRVLSRNPDILNYLGNEHIEIAVHGYVHKDYTKLSYDEIVSHMKHAIAVCNDMGIRPHGFRAPYLKTSNEVLRAIAAVGLEYDSSYTVCFGVLPKDSDYDAPAHQVLNACKTISDSPKLTRIEGILEIPVALPDDEWLVDQLHLAPKEVAKCWISALKESMRTDESVFVLQLHPERVAILSDTLIEVLEWAIRSNVRIRSLSEIAKNGTRPGENCMAITGDMDIVRLSDIARG
jgi:peptidoglycan/xylan/chitin deacetylase (PgdA/CDA1 family)